MVGSMYIVQTAKSNSDPLGLDRKAKNMTSSIFYHSTYLPCFMLASSFKRIIFFRRRQQLLFIRMTCAIYGDNNTENTPVIILIWVAISGAKKC